MSDLLYELTRTETRKPPRWRNHYVITVACTYTCCKCLYTVKLRPGDHHAIHCVTWPSEDIARDKAGKNQPFRRYLGPEPEYD